MKIDINFDTKNKNFEQASYLFMKIVTEVLNG